MESLRSQIKQSDISWIKHLIIQYGRGGRVGWMEVGGGALFNSEATVLHLNELLRYCDTEQRNTDIVDSQRQTSLLAQRQSCVFWHLHWHTVAWKLPPTPAYPPPLPLPLCRCRYFHHRCSSSLFASFLSIHLPLAWGGGVEGWVRKMRVLTDHTPHPPLHLLMAAVV